jgi:putative PEP-CTERM system TPR-repeat lipoprotein
MGNKDVFDWLLVLSLALFLTACVDKTAQQYLSASQAYYDDGEYTASLIEIKNAIQQDPGNPELRQFSAQLYLKLGNGDAAEFELRKASGLGIDESLLLPMQVQALYQQHKYKQLAALTLTEPLSGKDRATVLVYKGFAAAELNDFISAKKLYQQSIASDADNQLAYRGIAMLHASQDRFDKALQVIGQLIKKNPQQSELWSLQGDFYVSARQFDNAQSSYSKAIDIYQGDNYLDIAKRALVCLSKEDLDCTNQDLAVLTTNASAYYMTGYVKGLLAIKQKRWKDAETALTDALAVNSELTPAYYFAGLSVFQQQQYGAAISHLSTYVAREPDSVNGRHLLGLAQLQEDHLESAKSTLQPIILAGNAGPAIINMLGQIEYALGNVSASIQYFKQLSVMQPDSAMAHAQLGIKLMASGAKLAGLDELAVALKLAPGLLEAGQVSVLAYLDDNQFDKAQALINKLQHTTPDNAVLTNLQGVLHMQKAEFTQADNYFRQALKQSPGDPTASHNLAKLTFQQGGIQKAIQLYHKVLKHHPQHIPTHLKLAEFDLKQGNDIKAEQRLLKLIAQQPDALGPRLMLTQYYLLSGRVDAVTPMLEPVAQLYPKNQRLLTLLAESLLASGRAGKAKQEAEILVTQAPNSVAAHWLLARAAIANKDAMKGMAQLKQTLLLKPDHIPAQIVLVKMLAEKKQMQQAITKLQTLTRQSPGDPRVGSLVAWMAMADGNSDKAVQLYKKAVSLSATSANTLGLAQAQWHAGQREDTLATLKQWSLKHPGDMKTQFRLGMRFQQMGLDAEASARFSRVIKFEPDNVVALNNLAWLLRNEDSNRALKYIERAAELEPKSAPIFDTLGVVLLQQNNIARALRVFQRAAKAHPDHPSIQYHLAITLHKYSDTQQAINVLNQLIVKFPKFAEIEQAQQLLRTLKNSVSLT